MRVCVHPKTKTVNVIRPTLCCRLAIGPLKIDVRLGFTGSFVRFGSKADMCNAKRHVRFAPKSGHVQCN